MKGMKPMVSAQTKTTQKDESKPTAKLCSYCGEDDQNKFTPKDKYRCKACKSTEQRDWRAKNPIAAKEISRRGVRNYRIKLTTVLTLIKQAHTGDAESMTKLRELGEELNAQA